MSYWIYLEDDDGEPVSVPRFTEGGTHPIGGEDTATVNVTYNYRERFRFRTLNGRTGAETIAELRDAVQRLGTMPNPDYWDPTPGNVGRVCELLLGWAEMHPDATWKVS